MFRKRIGILFTILCGATIQFLFWPEQTVSSGIKYQVKLKNHRYISNAKLTTSGNCIPERKERKTGFWFEPEQSWLKNGRNRRKVDLVITVLAMNRHEALLRLLNSLETASYDGDAVRLIVRIDHAKDNAKVIELSTSFPFSHGEKHVVVSDKHLGLRKQWLDAWLPGDDDEK